MLRTLIVAVPSLVNSQAAFIGVQKNASPHVVAVDVLFRLHTRMATAPCQRVPRKVGVRSGQVRRFVTSAAGATDSTLVGSRVRDAHMQEQSRDVACVGEERVVGLDATSAPLEF